MPVNPGAGPTTSDPAGNEKFLMDWLWTSLYHALAMLWMTFWALLLGFSISAALQVFVSRKKMKSAFGETSLQSVAVATG